MRSLLVLTRLSGAAALACAFIVAAPLGAQPSPRLAALAGEWAFTMTGDDTPQRVVLAVDGDSLRGRVYGQRFVATVDGAQLRFAVGSYRWRATVGRDTLRGWLGVGIDSSRWTGVRFTPRAARTIDFAPTSWVRTFSAGEAPVLRLVPGDTVRTTTLDAAGWGTGGFGERGNKRWQGGNPLTGPFVVEGTLPGDVLVVRLLDVRLNRGWAFSGTSLMDRAIRPDYAAERGTANADNKWTLDTAAGVARLTKPGTGLAAFTTPLRPFLGAIGVAARDGAGPTTRDSGPFGGNMEYGRLTTGATLFLPVNVPGALFSLGDGHAAQGDGELTGDALETSMAVTFTVERLRYPGFFHPRAEDAEALMAIGVAGSLDEALRDATSEMARWLESAYALTKPEVALVMGTELRYDIPDIVPPWVSVVARVPRAALARLPRR
jgi:acetamidase/formamidase